MLFGTGQPVITYVQFTKNKVGFDPGSGTLTKFARDPSNGAITGSDITLAAVDATNQAGMYRITIAGTSTGSDGGYPATVKTSDTTVDRQDLSTVAYAFAWVNFLRLGGANGGVPLLDSNLSVAANLKYILGTALTETAGQLAAGFKKWFNVATPTSTMNEVTLVDTTTTLTNAPPDSTGVATLLARLGVFTGTGVNTVLGFLRAMSRSDLTAPSDMGGTFAPTTDSLQAIAANSGGGAPTVQQIVDGVWDESNAAHVIAGSTGYDVSLIPAIKAKTDTLTNGVVPTVVSPYNAATQTLTLYYRDSYGDGEAGGVITIPVADTYDLLDPLIDVVNLSFKPNPGSPGQTPTLEVASIALRLHEADFAIASAQMTLLNPQGSWRWDMQMTYLDSTKRTPVGGRANVSGDVTP